MTSDRLIHQPNRFDSMTGGRWWSTPRSSIKTIDVQPRTNAVPFLGMAAGLRNRLRVELDNGEVELFVVNRVGDVLSSLNSARGQHWLSLQRAAFEALAGQTVTFWAGVEMAFRETTPSGPQFADTEMPLLQVTRLEMKIGVHDFCTIHTYQNDTVWGLQLTPAQARKPREWEEEEGIYRHRVLDLPLGRIDSVDVRMDEGTLAEVTLRFSKAEMLLIAGEVQETFDGTLSLLRFDESVLVFTDPAAARTLAWIPPRNV